MQNILVEISENSEKMLNSSQMSFLFPIQIWVLLLSDIWGLMFLLMLFLRKKKKNKLKLGIKLR